MDSKGHGYLDELLYSFSYIFNSLADASLVPAALVPVYLTPDCREVAHCFERHYRARVVSDLRREGMFGEDTDCDVQYRKPVYTV